MLLWRIYDGQVQRVILFLLLTEFEPMWSFWTPSKQLLEEEPECQTHKIHKRDIKGLGARVQNVDPRQHSKFPSFTPKPLKSPIKVATSSSVKYRGNGMLPPHSKNTQRFSMFPSKSPKVLDYLTRKRNLKTISTTTKHDMFAVRPHIVAKRHNYFSVYRHFLKTGISRPMTTNSYHTFSIETGIIFNSSSTPTSITEPCSLHTDLCSCRNAHCGYNLGNNQCRDIIDICSQYKFTPTECVRFPAKIHVEVHYIYAGITCPLSTLDTGDPSVSTSEPSKNCEIDQTILAVNLGGDQRHTDSYGIQYMADNEIPWIDPHQTKKSDFSSYQFVVDKTEEWLYRWQIRGDGNNKAGDGKCVTFELKLSRDGKYQLCLKMVDNYSQGDGSRGFNVRLNGITILLELNLIQITQIQYKPFDLILNFQVTYQAHMLVISGYPSSHIHNGTVNLSFCYGECDTNDKAYHVAGFSVVKFVDPEISSSLAPECHQFRRLPCLCRWLGCEYNLETGDCRHLEECHNSFFSENECRRANGFYLDGGVLCRNTRETGNCNFSEVALAVNLNGEYYRDSKGIDFEADWNIPYEDKWEIMTSGISKECVGVSEEDRELYCNYIEGVNNKAYDKHCIKYQIPITYDGSYELNIKLGEFTHDNPDERSFDIKVNEVVVIGSMDLLMITEKNKPVDIYLSFTVIGNMRYVWMKGFALKFIEDEIMNLIFCYGSWGKVDASWTASAFSVLRFSNTFKNISSYTFST